MRLLRTPNGSTKWWLCALLVAALVPTFAGCYGSFQAVQSVHKFNGGVSDNKVVKTLTFWGLNIIPVYAIASFADAIIFNLVEFWAEKPAKTARQATDEEGTTYALTPLKDGRGSALTITREGEEPVRLDIARVGPAEFEITDAEGRLQRRYVKATNGSVRVVDAQGSVIRTLSADDLTLAAR